MATESGKDYGKVADFIRLGDAEIARRAGTSPTTVRYILHGITDGKQHVGEQKRKKIYEVIDAEVASLRRALNQLSGQA